MMDILRIIVVVIVVGTASYFYHSNDGSFFKEKPEEEFVEQEQTTDSSWGRFESYDNMIRKKSQIFIKGEDKPYTGILEEYNSGRLMRKAVVKNGWRQVDEMYHENGQVRQKSLFLPGNWTSSAHWIFNEDGTFRLYKGPRQWLPKQDEEGFIDFPDYDQEDLVELYTSYG